MGLREFFPMTEGARIGNIFFARNEEVCGAMLAELNRLGYQPASVEHDRLVGPILWVELSTAPSLRCATCDELLGTDMPAALTHVCREVRMFLKNISTPVRLHESSLFSLPPRMGINKVWLWQPFYSPAEVYRFLLRIAEAESLVNTGRLASGRVQRFMSLFTDLPLPDDRRGAMNCIQAYCQAA